VRRALEFRWGFAELALSRSDNGSKIVGKSLDRHP